jgi:hypothetical protein
MTRTLFSGGRVVDGTGADPAEADVVVEDGRILEIGPSLDGDERVDVSGKALLPGLSLSSPLVGSETSIIWWLVSVKGMPARFWPPPSFTSAPIRSARPNAIWRLPASRSASTPSRLQSPLTLLSHTAASLERRLHVRAD